MDPSPRPSSGLSPGAVIAGKFRLERVIGRGGMGSVWAARELHLDMPVALKFIETGEGDAAIDRDARARFEREARAAGQIRSPHVVQILDHGIDGDRPYIAMELLEGEDLGDRLRREKRISVAAAARILTQAAKALRRAHEAGIIHRDLKPGNVFLARFDDDEVVKILDFGVAKMRRVGSIDEPQATQVGVVFGSPSYMSPEQARGARVIDHRSDLWSMAVILFRAVTGVKPFQAGSIADLVIKLCIDPLPVPTHVARGLPPEIDRFFERAFARDPEQRFASAPEMAAAFEAVAASASAPVAPPPAATVPIILGDARERPPTILGDARERPPTILGDARERPPTNVAAAPQAPVVEAKAAAPALPAFVASTQPIAWLPGEAPSPVAAAHPHSGHGNLGGSGPHVAFASGTLTPPSGLVSPPVEPTSVSGTSSSPSGGWRAVPLLHDLAASGPTPRPPVEASHGEVAGGAAPLSLTEVLPEEHASDPVTKVLMPRAAITGSGPVAPVGAPPPGPLAARSGSGTGVLLAAVAAGVLSVVVVALLVIPRRGPRAVASDGAPVAAVVPASLEIAPPPSAPAAAASAPEVVTASASAPAAPAPETSASAAPRSAPRPGKKKKPNFGY